jgi:predicted metal-dependent hydrolase
MFRKIFAAWASFFLPRFHPWNEDDRGLIANYETSGHFAAAEPARKVRSAA